MSNITKNDHASSSGWRACGRRVGARLMSGPLRVAVVLACSCIGHASTATAQGVGITSVAIRQYVAGAPSPAVPPFPIPIGSVVCNQSMPVTTLHSASWDDPVNTGKACVYIDPGTGPLFAKVYGALEATITNIAGTLEGPESSPRVPFPRPPLAPTGLKVVQ